MHKQQGWPQAWEYCQSKPIQTLGSASQGVNWSWSQCIKSHHAQTSSGKELPRHFWTRNILRRVLPGLRRRRTGLLLSAPKSSFQMKVNVVFYLEIRVPESGGREERHRIHVLEVQCEVSTVSDDLGCRVICCLLLTSFMETLISFSSRTWHLPTLPKVPKAGSMTMVLLLDWPANSPDLNPIENLDERHQTQQCRWAEGRYQSHLGFFTPEQCHRLIVSMPRRIDAVIQAKGGPTKYWVHRNEHTFQKPDISV